MTQVKENQNIIIKCPKCGREWLLSEVFYPDDFMGKPEQIVKDPLGKILYVSYKEGYEPVFSQSFVCDCGETFCAEATVTVKSKTEVEELNFSKQTVSLLDD